MDYEELLKLEHAAQKAEREFRHAVLRMSDPEREAYYLWKIKRTAQIVFGGQDA